MFRGIATLLKPETSAAETSSVSQDILKRVGGKHAAHDWMRLLLVKISQQPFGNEHARKVLELVVGASKEKNVGSLMSALEHLVQLAHSAPQAFVGTAKELAVLVAHRDAAVVTAALPHHRVGGDVPGRTGRAQSQGVRAPQDAVRGGHGGAGQARRANAREARRRRWDREGSPRGRVRAHRRGSRAATTCSTATCHAALATIQVVGQEAAELFFERLRDVESYIVDNLLTRPLTNGSRARRP